MCQLLDSCHTFIAMTAGRPLKQRARCSQGTGLTNDDGDELLVEDFCRLSCGSCDKPNRTKPNNEYAEELEQLEEDGKIEEKVKPTHEEDKVIEKESDLWEELTEEENKSEEESLGDEEETNESVEEEPPLVEHGIGGQSYFVPLTALERDTLKERLRGVLKTTKDLILMASKREHEPVSTPARTLVLTPSAPKQFMHLQHYQTGSEAINQLIGCALGRQAEIHDGVKLHFSSVMEDTNLMQCMQDLAQRLGATYKDNQFYRNDEDGLPLMDAPFDPSDETLNIPLERKNACATSDADIMSFAASLGAVSQLGWGHVDSVAMFGNPMERTHRYYLQMAKECYSCR